MLGDGTGEISGFTALKHVWRIMNLSLVLPLAALYVKWKPSTSRDNSGIKGQILLQFESIVALSRHNRER